MRYPQEINDNLRDAETGQSDANAAISDIISILDDCPRNKPRKLTRKQQKRVYAILVEATSLIADANALLDRGGFV